MSRHPHANTAKTFFLLALFSGLVVAVGAVAGIRRGVRVAPPGDRGAAVALACLVLAFGMHAVVDYDLDFLAVSDFFLSETAELADVVLPSAMWAEEDGTMTNLEGRVIRRRRALDPPAGVPDDLQLLATLAERLGAGRYFSGDPETVFEELRRASAGGVADYSGISYRRIDDEQGVFWPCPEESHPGTPRLFTERFATPDGRARFLRVEHVEARPLSLGGGIVIWGERGE